MLGWGDVACLRGCRRHPSKSFPKCDKNPFPSGKRAVSEILTCPRSPQCTVIRREKSLEERLISGGDKHVSWQEGREEKTFFLARSCLAVNSLRYCFTNKPEDGLPIRRVLHQSPRRPMAENIERNLPMYQSTVE